MQTLTQAYSSTFYIWRESEFLHAPSSKWNYAPFSSEGSSNTQQRSQAESQNVKLPRCIWFGFVIYDYIQITLHKKIKGLGALTPAESICDA